MFKSIMYTAISAITAAVATHLLHTRKRKEERRESEEVALQATRKAIRIIKAENRDEEVSTVEIAEAAGGYWEWVRLHSVNDDQAFAIIQGIINITHRHHIQFHGRNPKDPMALAIGVIAYTDMDDEEDEEVFHPGGGDLDFDRAYGEFIRAVGGGPIKVDPGEFDDNSAEHG